MTLSDVGKVVLIWLASVLYVYTGYVGYMYIEHEVFRIFFSGVMAYLSLITFLVGCYTALGLVRFSWKSGFRIN